MPKKDLSPDARTVVPGQIVTYHHNEPIINCERQIGPGIAEPTSRRQSTPKEAGAALVLSTIMQIQQAAARGQLLTDEDRVLLTIAGKLDQLLATIDDRASTKSQRDLITWLRVAIPRAAR